MTSSQSSRATMRLHQMTPKRLSGQQVMLGGLASSASMELRRLGLEMLYHVLQASGHTLLVGWETIVEVLGSVCQPVPSGDHTLQSAPSSPGRRRPLPPYLQEKGYYALLKIA